MSTDDTLITNKTRRIALIIIGILVAVLLTWNSRSLFAGEVQLIPFDGIELTATPTAVDKDQPFEIDASAQLQKVTKFALENITHVLKR